jgi:hypothetical protein
MKKSLKKPKHPLFKPQDRYYLNEQGLWWFFTVDRIEGPSPNKTICINACRNFIQKREGVI